MVRHKEGREFPIWLTASLIRDAWGEPLAMVGIIRDITERRQAEKELKRHREHLVEMVEERTVELKTAVQLLTGEINFRKMTEETLKENEAKFRKLSLEFNTLLNAMPDTLILLSRELKVMWANSAAALTLGKGSSELKGLHCFEMWYNRSEPCEDCFVLRSFRSGNSESSQRSTPSGRLFDGRAFPLKDEDGAVNSVIIVLTDITEKAALQAEAMRAGHLASLGELAAGVAHEINNPINGIINYAQILANKIPAGSKENEISHRIIREGDRIAGIVRSLLSFARERKEERVPVAIRKILSDTTTLTETQIRKDGIDLLIDIPDGLPEIVANPQQIQQVFLNIISNARYALNQKYPGAHTDKKFVISGERVLTDDSLYVRITFCDMGAGIAPDDIEKVMNPFYSTKPSGQGTGLGLSISHGIVRGHGGRLVLDSVEGAYTKVIIDLPAKERDGR
jgi:PAS domain S-box-containing protein